MNTRVLFPLLALGNFIVGAAAIVVVGLLPQISTGFSLDKAEAGWLMTVYALVYAVSSPLLVALTGQRDRAHVLTAGLVLLAFGLSLAAWGPSFQVLLFSRAVMALGSGLVTPVSTGIVVAMVPLAERGRALATVFGGLTLAQAFAVPLGSLASQRFTWHVPFVALAVMATTAAVVLFRVAPRAIPARPTTLSTLASVLVRPKHMVAVSFVFFFFTGVMALFTYITPFLAERAGIQGHGLTAMLLVFGLGAILGNAIGGRLTDKLGPIRTLLVLCAGEVLVLPLITMTRLPALALAGAILMWSVVTWSIHVPQQARLGMLDPERAPVLLALHAAALYCGFSLGSVIGGQVLRAYDFDAIGVVGVGAMLLSLASIGVVQWLSSSATNVPQES